MKQLNSTDCAFFYFVGRVEGARVSSVEVLNVRVDEQLVPLASRFSSMQSSLSFSGFLYFMSTASHHRIASVWAYPRTVSSALRRRRAVPVQIPIIS